MSLGVIVGVVVIGTFLHSWVRRQIRKDEMQDRR
jgi:heme A synthase